MRSGQTKEAWSHTARSTQDTRVQLSSDSVGHGRSAAAQRGRQRDCPLGARRGVWLGAMGFWLGTLVFFLIQVVVTGTINWFGAPGNKGLPHIMGFTAVFQCWLMWAIVYMAQLNPLVMPEYKE